MKPTAVYCFICSHCYILLTSQCECVCVCVCLCVCVCVCLCVYMCVFWNLAVVGRVDTYVLWRSSHWQFLPSPWNDRGIAFTHTHTHTHTDIRAHRRIHYSATATLSL